MKRLYQYIGELTIKKSRFLKKNVLPKDDILKWFFLTMDERGEKRYTFFYKIENPSKSFYGKPFIVQISFIMEDMDRIIELGQTYGVWRGKKPIGFINIISNIE